MTFNDYQRLALSTAVYPEQGKNLVYPTLGLAGEAGEFAEQVKKSIRDDSGVITAPRKDALAKELGDVLWYIAAAAFELGLSLEAVATANLQKLQARKESNKIHGEGSSR